MAGLSRLKLFLGILVFSIGFFSMPNMFLSEKYKLLEEFFAFIFLGSFYILYGGKFFTQKVKVGKISKESLSSSLPIILYFSIIIFISYKFEGILSSEIFQTALWVIAVLGILKQWDKDNNNLENDIKKLEEFNKSE